MSKARKEIARLCGDRTQEERVRNVFTKDECARGGYAAAEKNTDEQRAEWGRQGGLISGRKRRAKADAIPVKGSNDE